jgi:hypothetical protein
VEYRLVYLKAPVVQVKTIWRFLIRLFLLVPAMNNSNGLVLSDKWKLLLLSGAKKSLVFQGKLHRFSKKESPRVHLREEAGGVLLVNLSVLVWKSTEMMVFHVRNLTFQSKVLGAR